MFHLRPLLTKVCKISLVMPFQSKIKHVKHPLSEPMKLSSPLVLFRKVNSCEEI